jgi:hypothetical protein
MTRSSWRATGWYVLVAAVALVTTSGCAHQVDIPTWNPAAFRDLETLEFLTVGPTEGKHWSTVWLVVVDDQVYLRLGSRAADRMRQNTTSPFVALRIGGHEYERVRATEAAAMAERVGAAMGEKYWSDVLIRYFPHPLVMRLEPDAAPAPD